MAPPEVIHRRLAIPSPGMPAKMTAPPRYPALERLECDGKPRVVSDDGLLARAEQALGGVKLPASYRFFAKTFGSGLLCNFWMIFVPLEGGDSFVERREGAAEMIARGVEDGLFDYRPDGSKTMVERLVPFAASENGDLLAWDPEDRSGSDEMRIFRIHTRFAAVRGICADLDELVAICLDEKRAEATFGEAARLFTPRFVPQRPA